MGMKRHGAGLVDDLTFNYINGKATARGLFILLLHILTGFLHGFDDLIGRSKVGSITRHADTCTLMAFTDTIALGPLCESWTGQSQWSKDQELKS